MFSTPLAQRKIKKFMNSQIQFKKIMKDCETWVKENPGNEEKKLKWDPAENKVDPSSITKKLKNGLSPR